VSYRERAQAARRGRQPLPARRGREPRRHVRERVQARGRNDVHDHADGRVDPRDQVPQRVAVHAEVRDHELDLAVRRGHDDHLRISDTDTCRISLLTRYKALSARLRGYRSAGAEEPHAQRW